jgi:aspartate racemase
MKTIGLLGGMSWESTTVYYRLINQGVRDRLGTLRSARIVLYSVDFSEIEQLQRGGRWDEAGALLAGHAGTLERAGAHCLVLCTNTMHKVAPVIEAATSTPLLHIADATAAAVAGHGARTVGLLGTAFTMEQEFFRGRLQERFGLQVLVPQPAERREVHRIIYEELCAGLIVPESRPALRQTMAGLVAAGAEVVLLSCTELMLLVRAEDCPVPIVDSTARHARAAVDFALSDP